MVGAGWTRARTTIISPSMYGALLLLGLRVLLLRAVERVGPLRQAGRRLLGPARDVPLRLRAGTVWLGSASWDIDFLVFVEVFLSGMYRTQCAGKIVIDLGAHRGYYSLYALLHGAAHIYAFEPHSGNYAGLVRTLEAIDPARLRWSAYRSAVSDRPGEVNLFVSPESWGHSLYPQLVGDASSVERVRANAFSVILDAIRRVQPSRPIVVKINIEGAAGDVILGTPVALWREVSDVLFDYEPGSPHPRADLLRHLASAGLTSVEADSRRIVRVHRSGA